METTVRQRVIGGVVLVALAIIFLPLLFKGAQPKAIRHAAIETSIPSAPAKPNAQATITMQGEELSANTQQASANLQNQPDVQTSENISAPEPLAVQPQSPVATKPATQAKLIEPVKNAVKTPTPTEEEIVIEEPIAANKPIKASTVKVTKQQAVEDFKAEREKVKAPATAKDKVSANTAKKTHAKLQPAKAWVVQLGSFGDAAKAKKLEKQLRAKGFVTYTRSMKTPIGKMTRVFVGPEVKQNKAKNLLAKLDTDMHLKGVVIPFNPVEIK